MRTIFKEIEYNGKTYKLVFNLNVMQAIQEEYTTLDNWGSLTDGTKHENETDVKALIYGLTQMFNEGIEITNEETGASEPLLTTKQVGRMVSALGMESITATMNSLVVDSTASEGDSKNG